jgi:DNA-binding transcriptional ArsR family regulator
MSSSPTQKSISTAAAALTAAPLASRPSLQQQAEAATTLLKSLANRDRLLLLCHLVEGECSVAKLGAMTGITQPTLSQQLAVLRAEGLVATRREGKFIHYSIDSPAARAVLQTLYDLYCKDTQKPVH